MNGKHELGVSEEIGNSDPWLICTIISMIAVEASKAIAVRKDVAPEWLRTSRIIASRLHPKA